MSNHNSEVIINDFHYMRENLVDKENELTVMVVESLEESRLTILMKVYSLDVK